MIFSYIESGAGSKADSTLPAFPTTVSISGSEATAISNNCKTLLFSSAPEWGREVGINKKLPSSKAGINSLPVFLNKEKPMINKTTGKLKKTILYLKQSSKSLG